MNNGPFKLRYAYILDATALGPIQFVSADDIDQYSERLITCDFNPAPTQGYESLSCRVNNKAIKIYTCDDRTPVYAAHGDSLDPATGTCDLIYLDVVDPTNNADGVDNSGDDSETDPDTPPDDNNGEQVSPTFRLQIDPQCSATGCPFPSYYGELGSVTSS